MWHKLLQHGNIFLLLGFFERKIFVPLEDIGSNCWKVFFQSTEHKPTCPKSALYLDKQLLSIKSQGYSLGVISACLKKVLSKSAIEVQELEKEIIEQLSSSERKTDESYLDFSKKFCQCSQE